MMVYPESIEDKLEVTQIREMIMSHCQTLGGSLRVEKIRPVNDHGKLSNYLNQTAECIRILVHKDTIVYSSERTLVKYDENQDYVKKYGLASIWPTVDFGWVASVRFGLCADEGLR